MSRTRRRHLTNPNTTFTRVGVILYRYTSATAGLSVRTVFASTFSKSRLRPVRATYRVEISIVMFYAHSPDNRKIQIRVFERLLTSSKQRPTDIIELCYINESPLLVRTSRMIFAWPSIYNVRNITFISVTIA